MFVVIVFVNESSDFVTGVLSSSVHQGKSNSDHYIFIGSIIKNDVLGDFNDWLDIILWVLSNGNVFSSRNLS